MNLQPKVKHEILARDLIEGDWVLDFLGLELWKSHEFGEMDLRVTKQKDFDMGLKLTSSTKFS